LEQGGINFLFARRSYQARVLRENRLIKSLSTYILLLFAFLGVWIISMGGGIWGESAVWHQQWQHLMFDYLCHQIPGRSFWINGQPMAVCARCFGIYSGMFTGWLILPWLYGYLDISKRTALMGIGVAGGFNVLDVGINSFITTLQGAPLRWVLGVLLGISVIVILISKSNNRSYE